MEEHDSGTMMVRTLELLQQTRKTIPEIYKETGINYYWLRKFRSGEIKDPSVNRVQKLYEYLTGKPLSLPENQ